MCDFPGQTIPNLFPLLLGMSESFLSEGLPAILVYRGTEVIGNYPNVAEAIVGEGNEIYYDELESFFIDNGILYATVTRHNTMELLT